MRSHQLAVAALILALLSGCATTRAKVTEYRDRQQRQEQVERIVNRTITKPQVVEKIVYKDVRLPPSLTKPCVVVYAQDRKVGSIVSAYKEGIPHSQDCAKRMDEIRSRQPKEDMPEPEEE